MIVATWNVLHRIHADNWQEPAIDAHPDEGARIAAISARIAALAADVICLQEVSGDQVASLRAACAGAELHAAPYPRVPRPRARGTTSALADPTEYLVTIVRAGGARLAEAVVFDDDRGKGYLAVELADGLLVVNTHVTYGEPRRGQLARIVQRVGPADRVVITGDFNADRAAVAAGLGAELAFAEPGEPALPTRPRPTGPTGATGATGATRSQTIDHIVTRGLRCRSCTVVDCGGLSDHNLVVADLGVGITG